MKKNKLFILIGAIIILSLVITAIILSGAKNKKSKIGRTEEGYYYNRWQVSDISPRYDSISKDGGEYRFYHIVKKNLQIFSVGKKKTIWQSGIIVRDINNVLWSAGQKHQAIIIYTDTIDGEIINRFGYINTNGELKYSLSTDVEDVGWWSDNEIYGLRFSGDQEELVLFNAADGKEKKVINVIDQQLNKIYIAPNHTSFFGINYWAGGETQDQSYTGTLDNSGGAVKVTAVNVPAPENLVWSPKSGYFAALYDQSDYMKAIIYGKNNLNYQIHSLNIASDDSLDWLGENTIIATKQSSIGTGQDMANKLFSFNIYSPKKETNYIVPAERINIYTLTAIDNKTAMFTSDNYLYRLKLEKK